MIIQLIRRFRHIIFVNPTSAIRIVILLVAMLAYPIFNTRCLFLGLIAKIAKKKLNDINIRCLEIKM